MPGSSMLLVALLLLFCNVLVALGEVYIDDDAPLLVACRDGHDINIENIRTLISEGQDPNVKNTAGWTPLTFAVNDNNDELTRVLLDSGIYVNEQENDVRSVT